MRALNRKLLRDLWHLRGPFGAVVLVVASGIALFVALRSMNGYLRGAQAEYYRAHRFAQVFASARRAPERLAADLEEIPGIAALETRIVADVLLDVPDLPEPATGRVFSLPEGEGKLNLLSLQSGRLPAPGEHGTVVASAAFARANELDLGDTLGAVLHGRWQTLRIVGTAVSPELIYEIRGAGDIFPDNRRFGALWMQRSELEAAFDLEDAFNDVTATLTPYAVEADVLARLDERLAPYGGRGAYGRDDHISHRFLSDEITETQVTSVMIPSIFLAVTAFLVHLVMSRLVALQREQIAVLKAFGYPSRSVGAHYLLMALVPVGAGGALGLALGFWFARGLAGIYARFFQFPAAEAGFRADPLLLLVGLVIAGGAALLGALSTVNKVLALPPAESMRPEAPTSFRISPLERGALRRRLPLPARSVARHLYRHPIKATLSVIGLAAAGAILVASRFGYDAVDWLRTVQFEHVQREDLQVTFREPRGSDALDELAHLPGVLRVEPFRLADARLLSRRRGHLRERVGLVGLQAGTELRRVVDEDLRVRVPPAKGLLLSSLLAEHLEVEPGDFVDVEVLEGKRTHAELRVEAVTDDLLGTAAYLDLAELQRILADGNAFSGAFLRVDESATERLYFRLKHLPGITGVAVRKAVLQGFERTIAENFRISLSVTVLFACVIAAGMVYNGARVALSERGRELASLRVLGFSRREVASILLGEQATLTLVSLPAGIALGYGLCWLMVVRFQSELFRIPLVVSAATVAFALTTIAIAAFGASFIVRRRLDRFDLVSVLKSRE